MEKIRYQKNWNLNKIFQGGSKSNQFINHIKRLEVQVSDLNSYVKSFAIPIAINETAHLVDL
ncbi:hypothetical protein [Psychrobacillus sp. NPDC096389]|uniref:hypothetical protein n=1 Tax=Psychrobacillus sp. NPDC096389 TaxID=3364490 RepID=UPI003803993D